VTGQPDGHRATTRTGYQRNLTSQPKAHGLLRVCASDCLCRLPSIVLVGTERERDADVAPPPAGRTREQHLQAAGFILRGIRGVLVIIGSVIAGVICAFVAKSKGYSAVLFGILGLIFSIITLIVVLVIPRKR